ncbi:MAG TPA: hypothetical protein PK181_10045 [Methanothrix soehngenii]|jgi:archaellum component FlaC|nr:hypothetical protein [Methanothrix soehngenii]
MKKVKAPKGKFIETDEKLIKAVANELNTTSAPMILSKLQDIEKAVYHLASRVKAIGDSQERLEQLSVGLTTTMEEVLHDLEGSDEGTEQPSSRPNNSQWN